MLTVLPFQGGGRAYGEISCPDAAPMDQGAYSCEAINSKGSCFAGSPGCGQPGQDAILVRTFNCDIAQKYFDIFCIILITLNLSGMSNIHYLILRRWVG